MVFYSLFLEVPVKNFHTTLESMKNGYIVSGKYEGRIRSFKPCPVCVLANFLPDYTKLSMDRWEVVELGAGNYATADTIPLHNAETIKSFVPPKPLPDLERNIDILHLFENGKLRIILKILYYT